jgi:nucleotide-binding universal stress UspA family protein
MPRLPSPGSGTCHYLADQNVKVLTAVLPPIAFIDVDKAQGVRATLMAEARRLVTDAVSELRLTGKFSSGEVVIEDDGRQAIVTTAREWPADLIAMGARGLGSVARFFLGRVSHAVARDAPCPVLICKGQPRKLLSVTVALDGSDHARRALGWLTSELTLSRASAGGAGGEPTRPPRGRSSKGPHPSKQITAARGGHAR